MNNFANLPEINQEQALNLSKFFIQSNHNLFLFGRHGTGKSCIAMQAARECGFEIGYINLSVIERSDLAGYPDINSPGDIIKFKSPFFLPKLIDKPNLVLLFDEVDKTPPEVTAPLLEILQFRKINGVSLNVVSCILTGNLSNEGAYSNQISSALLDRAAKYVLTFDFQQWIDWAKQNQVHDLIIGFLRNNPEFACGKADDVCYASPSPRGWVMASEALIRAKELKIVDLESITQIVSGFVGNEAGLRFRLWYEHYRKFEGFIHSLIDSGSMTLRFDELMPTEKIIFVISACYYAKQKTFEGKKEKFIYLENLCKFFSKYKVDHEIKVMGLYNAFDFNMITKHKLYACKEFFELFSKITENVIIKK